jgi:hypothetical protein
MNFDTNRTGMTDPVREWAALPEEMPLRRFFVYAPYGLYGGFAAWIVAIAVVVAVGAALVGSPLALVMVVALVGGRFRSLPPGCSSATTASRSSSINYT